MTLFVETGFGGAGLASWYILASWASAAMVGSKVALCVEVGDSASPVSLVGLVDSRLFCVELACGGGTGGTSCSWETARWGTGRLAGGFVRDDTGL